MFPDEFPFAVFPEPRGLLPFGATDNGDLLLWRTSSKDADAWSTVILNPRESDVCTFDGGMTQLLTALIEGWFGSTLLPDELFVDGVFFRPIVEGASPTGSS